jgi:hypothetical protein
MQMAQRYVPKIDDAVFIEGNGFVWYVVVQVNAKRETADVKTTFGPAIILHRDVPWANLWRNVFGVSARDS